MHSSSLQLSPSKRSTDLEMSKITKGYLLILLFLSFILSTLAVPSSRSFIVNQIGLESLVPHGSRTQGEIINHEVDWVKEVGRKNKRLDIELTDYEGTGANKNHDPRNPGN